MSSAQTVLADDPVVGDGLRRFRHLRAAAQRIRPLRRDAKRLALPFCSRLEARESPGFGPWALAGIMGEDIRARMQVLFEGEMSTVCSAERLYHYLLGDNADLASILDQGLLPLSSRQDSSRWKEIEAWRPGFYRKIYEDFAMPVLHVPFTNSGVFLTPIDFRSMPTGRLRERPRFTIPLDVVDPAASALTYVLAGRRVVRSLSPDTLEEASAIWSEELVRAWFGKDPSMVFYYVPQVAAYQEGGIRVRPEWLEK
jgi:hypothetical protein